MIMKRGDTAPLLRAQLLDGERPVDLYGCSVSLVLYGPEDAEVYDGPALIVDEEQGWIGLDWSMTDPETDIEGTIRIEAEVTYPSGRRQTFPAQGTESMTINPKLRPWPPPPSP